MPQLLEPYVPVRKHETLRFPFSVSSQTWLSEQYVVEIGEGQCVSRIFPLTEEVENTEWLPGVIALLTEAETDYPHFDTCCNILTAIPPVIEEELSCLIPWLFFPFDFTTMLPGAGTQRKLLL